MGFEDFPFLVDETRTLTHTPYPNASFSFSLSLLPSLFAQLGKVYEMLNHEMNALAEVERKSAEILLRARQLAEQAAEWKQ